jgi:hypothetical protein
MPLSCRIIGGEREGKVRKEREKEEKEKERKGEKKIISLSLIFIPCPSRLLAKQQERVSFENAGYYEIEFFVSTS